jgi:hypothetical protein
MRDTEAAALLTYAASIDSRLGTPGVQDAKRWAELLEGLDRNRCLAAIKKHYQESDERIMPAHIRRLARSITDVAAEPIEIEPLVSRSGQQLEPHAGEVLCPDCLLIHRRDESCEEFARNRRRELPRPLASTVKAITDGTDTPASQAQERALQRARAERGNVPWTAPREEPPEDPGRPREERDVVDVTLTVEALAALRNAPVRSCLVCAVGPSGLRAVFTDTAEGRAAHHEVFRHEPRADREGASTGAE